jgi:hypothetical protein
MITRRSLPIGLLLCLAGCGNPVIDQKVADLPPEVSGVPPSEYHRPNQPCLLCHGPYGGAKPQMSVAGTINAIPISGKKKAIGVEDVVVTITDSFGEVKTKKTNCIGNFFITADEWEPGFPLAAKIEYPTPGGAKDAVTPAYMSTRIGREGSCAGCHDGERSESSPGIVFCVEADSSPFPAPTSDDCKGVPPQ